MNRFQRFSIAHHLSDYPEEWSYKQIIDELKSGDQGRVIDPWFLYECLTLEDLAELIQDMTDNLQRRFR